MKQNRYFGMCSATRASGVWLREWIEFHILSGVDHLWLVNDNDEGADDGTEAILEFYSELGFVTVIPGRMPVRHPGCRSASGAEAERDCAAPKHCAERMAHLVQWWIFAGPDEFAYAHAHCSLSDYIRSTCDPRRAAVYVRWERFGTSGHTVHPSGLLTENFLSSGGDCSAVPELATQRPVCRRYPFMPCAECRNTRVLYNSGSCVTPDHVSWAHCLGNTSEWKEQEGSRWASSPGAGDLPFKSGNCRHVAAGDMEKRCNTWIADPALRQRYSAACCEAGIGLNLYGSKSLQLYDRRTGRGRKVDLRGSRAALDVVDLNDFVSSSILRFVRVLRERMVVLGNTPSSFVDFLTVQYTKAGADFNGTCFVESGYAYSGRGFSKPPLEATASIDVPGSKSPEMCCRVCWETEGCLAWTAQPQCTLLVPSQMAVQQRYGQRKWPRPIPGLVEAKREWRMDSVSGIVGFEPSEAAASVEVSASKSPEMCCRVCWETEGCVDAAPPLANSGTAAVRAAQMAPAHGRILCLGIVVRDECHAG
eukprot:gene5070-7790_t